MDQVRPKRMYFRDVSGIRFSHLVAQWPVGKNRSGAVHWLCLCDCGNLAIVGIHNLNSGSTKGCGCLRLKPNGRASQDHILACYKIQAKKRGFQWQLPDDEFFRITSELCHYCGAAPTNTVRPRYSQNALFKYNGVDRKDSSGDYTLDNVVPACKVCQRAKLNMPYEEFLIYLGDVTKFLWNKHSQTA